MDNEPLFYTDPTAITPVMPVDTNNKLKELAVELIKKSSALNNVLSGGAREAIGRVVEPMNAYYTNLIEGIKTFPMDIHDALERKNLPTDKTQKQKQLEAIAIIEVSLLMKKRVDEGIEIFSVDFPEMLHGEFYKRIDTEFRVSLTRTGNKIEIIPGIIREGNVSVGNHVAPAGSKLAGFLEFFFNNYNDNVLSNPIDRVIAIAASHHRLAWIHPFVDGNGRVTRLFSQAWLTREALNSNGLWSVSRGLSRRRADYYAYLANADLQRLNDYDGRGNLSDKMLFEFCSFFLETAIDQVAFMGSILKQETLEHRLLALTDLLVFEKKIPKDSKPVLEYAFLKGSVKPGKEMERITGRSENVARSVLKRLEADGWLIAGNESKALQINFPVKYARYLFPGLYPAEEEMKLISR